MIFLHYSILIYILSPILIDLSLVLDTDLRLSQFNSDKPGDIYESVNIGFHMDAPQNKSANEIIKDRSPYLEKALGDKIFIHIVFVNYRSN